MTDPLDSTVASEPGGAEHDEAYCSACNQSFGVDRDVCPNDGARLIKLKAARDEILGRVFEGRYEVRASLGQGGMGTVYRALQISVDREVAIKVIHPKLANDRTAVKRFLREARLASRLSQPNIVNVYDFGQTDDGILYLVMELLRGHTLARELEAKRSLPLRRVLTIARQLCDALEVAHGQGIVHRDLKPSNIVILDDPPGRDLVKVLDFGLAKSLRSDTTSLTTNSDAILGTPLYIPPEQIDGRPGDARSDLYSFGCILYHLLTGVPPFVRENASLVLAAHLHEPPPKLPPEVPARVARLIGQMMAKDLAARPASVAEMRAVLDEVGDGRAATPPPTDLDVHADTPPSRVLERSSDDAMVFAMTAQQARPAVGTVDQSVAPPAGRARVWIAVGAIAAIAIAGGAALVLRGGHEAATTVDARTLASPPSVPAATASDAPPVVTVPAATASDASPVVTVPADAAAPASVPPTAHDAGTHAHPPAHAHVDAGAAPLDFVRPPAPPAPPDAMPDLDFTHGH